MDLGELLIYLFTHKGVRQGCLCMCRTRSLPYLTHVNGATIHLDTSHDIVLAPSTFFPLCLKLRNPSTKDKTRFEEFPRIGSDYCVNQID